jgi:hypothetical protein
VVGTALEFTKLKSTILAVRCHMSMGWRGVIFRDHPKRTLEQRRPVLVAQNGAAQQEGGGGRRDCLRSNNL